MRRFADSWAAIHPRLGELGITRVANVTGLDNLGVPVVMACRPMARTLSVFQGKGLTLEAARVSGAMEAIESFHAEEQLELPARTATRAELAGDLSAVDLVALPLRRGASFDVHRSVGWIEGRELLTGRACWVPEPCVRLMHDDQLASTSNGLASGNTPAEALSHAVCEVVERHSTAIWQGLPGELRRATRIDLSTVDDDGCRWVLDRFERADLEVGAFNLTCEIGIPVVAAYIAQRAVDGRRRLLPAAGFGCHPDRAIALARALTEAAQSRLTHIVGTRDDMDPAQYSEQTRAEFIGHVRGFIHAGGGRHFHTLPTHASPLMSEDLDWELSRLRGVGVEQVVAFDLTRPDLRIPVVRVVIPGFQMPGRPSAEMMVT